MKNLSVLFLIGLTVMTLQGCKKESEAEQAQVEKVYTKVGVNKLTINAYPAIQSDGSDWDDNIFAGTYPDIYFQFNKTGTFDLLYGWPTSSRKENLRNADLPSSWSVTGGGTFYTHSTLNQGIDIDLFDYDDVGGPELIGTTTIRFSDYTSGSNKYPSSINLSQNGVSLKLDVTWIE
jgi:hypothetical protein